MKDINRMSVKEFRELGYLLEINRRFLHPLGLALEVTQHKDGTESISGVWDYRNDPEGMNYQELDEDDVNKINFILEEETRRRAERIAALGYWVQPYE